MVAISPGTKKPTTMPTSTKTSPATATYTTAPCKPSSQLWMVATVGTALADPDRPRRAQPRPAAARWTGHEPGVATARPPQPHGEVQAEVLDEVHIGLRLARRARHAHDDPCAPVIPGIPGRGPRDRGAAFVWPARSHAVGPGRSGRSSREPGARLPQWGRTARACQAHPFP